MASIKATVSAVDTFTYNSKAEYSIILQKVSDIIAEIDKYLLHVQNKIEVIGRQVSHARIMRDDVQSKEKRYQAQMEEAYREVSRCEARIDYIYDHPITETYTDDDGEEHTREIVDEYALRVAQEQKEEAQREYRRYKEKYDYAYSVLCEIWDTLTRLEKIKHGCELIEQSLQSDKFEINKHWGSLSDEMSYNVKSLESVLSCLNSYLTSRPIVSPNGTSSISHAKIPDGASGYTSTSAGTYDAASVNVGERKISNVDVFESLPDNNISADVTFEHAGTVKEISGRYFNKQSKKDEKRITERQRQAVDEYCSNTDYNPTYAKINSFLRGQSGDIPAQLERYISDMTHAISNSAIKRDCTVYRGIQEVKHLFEKNIISIEEINEKYVGSIYVDEGFCSTSIAEKAATKFANYITGAVCEIHIPAGAEGIYTGRVSRFNSDEQEILLQRGSMFMIDGVSDCDGIKKVHLTLIGRMPL